MDPMVEERNRVFFENLRNMSDEELASRIENRLFAPNPHYVNEAARRLRERNK